MEMKMRSIWLASAAFMVTAGMAVAQVSTPAPEGATNVPVETAPGQSPGKTAPPASATSGQMSATTGQGSKMGPASAPAPEGATNAPQITYPGGSPGKTAPNNSQSTGTAGMAP